MGKRATQISSKTIVPRSADYGMATDVRIAADGQYVFAFHETATPAATYLHGAKYALTDSFERVAGTGPPIASGKAVSAMLYCLRPRSEGPSASRPA